MLFPQSERPVGFYVHHHGSGHATRCKLLARQLPPARVTVFTTATERFADWTGGTVVALPPDVTPERDPALDHLTDRVLHYAPTDVPPVRERMALMANWIAEQHPVCFVVDLSVEVALFTRLCGVATWLVRLHGRRTDRAHRAAFELADRLVAPFPRELDDAHTPPWVRNKTHYLPAASRYDDRQLLREAALEQLGYAPDRPLVTVINGTGGGHRSPAVWADVARANPAYDWCLVGQLADPPGELPDNLTVVGRVADTYPYLRAAAVVVGSGGTNTMWEIGAARRPFLSLPEPRPFDEQQCKMEALAALGLTIALPEVPAPAEWPALLRRARQLPVDAWTALFTA